MQQRSPGQRIWRLIGPIIVKMAVAFVVEADSLMQSDSSVCDICASGDISSGVQPGRADAKDSGADRWCFEIRNTD